MRIQSVCFWGAIAALLAGPASAQGIASLPALKPAVEELKKELLLTDPQVSEAERLLIGQMDRAKAAVENFGGISFDSVLDLIVEARATREEFIPAMRNLLTDQQKAKLAKLPKAHEVYAAAVAGWLTEAQIGKLRSRIGLTDEQVTQVRPALLEQYRDAALIVVGLVRNEDDKSMKKTVLDAVVDLRTVQRTAEREMKRNLTDVQKEQFESYHEESAKKSREKGEK